MKIVSLDTINKTVQYDPDTFLKMKVVFDLLEHGMIQSETIDLLQDVKHLVEKQHKEATDGNT